MKLDPVLLNMACSWSIKAYKEKNKDALKIENKWTSATAFIVKRKTIDVIVFRGTKEKLDILTDIAVIPVPYVKRLCHGGFVAQHASIWGKIKKHIDYDKRTLICGHSLGGALAELTAAKLWKKHDNLNLITFGKPNVFFKGFKRPMALDNQISCVHGSDLVARIPRLMYGASSSQTMLYFANCGINFVHPDELTKKADRGGIKDRIEDHLMDGYAKRLLGFLSDQDKEEKEDIKDLEEIADEIEAAD